MSDSKIFWNGDVYVLDFDDSERDILGTLPHQIRGLLAENDPDTYRLFPPAYMNDIVKQEEYRAYMAEELMQHHLADLDMLEQTSKRESLDENELMSWMRALNQVRLVLGTRLDIDEETDVADISNDHPEVELYQLYFYLGWLLENCIDALEHTVENNTDE